MAWQVTSSAKRAQSWLMAACGEIRTWLLFTNHLNIRIMSKTFSIQRIQRAIGSRPIVFDGELVATFFGFFFLSEHKEISLSDTTSEQIQSVCTSYDKMDDETINLLLEKLNA